MCCIQSFDCCTNPTSCVIYQCTCELSHMTTRLTFRVNKLCVICRRIKLRKENVKSVHDITDKKQFSSFHNIFNFSSLLLFCKKSFFASYFGGFVILVQYCVSVLCAQFIIICLLTIGANRKCSPSTN